MVKVDSKWQVWWLWHSLWNTSHYRWTCSYEEKEENLVDALSGAATTVVKMLQSNANTVTVSSHTQPKMNSVRTGISPLKFAQFRHNCLEGLKRVKNHGMMVYLHRRNLRKRNSIFLTHSKVCSDVYSYCLTTFCMSVGSLSFIHLQNRMIGCGLASNPGFPLQILFRLESLGSRLVWTAG